MRSDTFRAPRHDANQNSVGDRFASTETRHHQYLPWQIWVTAEGIVAADDLEMVSCLASPKWVRDSSDTVFRH